MEFDTICELGLKPGEGSVSAVQPLQSHRKIQSIIEKKCNKQVRKSDNEKKFHPLVDRLSLDCIHADTHLSEFIFGERDYDDIYGDNLMTYIHSKMKKLFINNLSINCHVNRPGESSIRATKALNEIMEMPGLSAYHIATLLEYGADPNAQVGNRSTIHDFPIHHSVRLQDLKITRYLINAKAKINLVNSDDRTALFLACEYDVYPKMINFLLTEHSGYSIIAIARSECE